MATTEADMEREAEVAREEAAAKEREQERIQMEAKVRATKESILSDAKAAPTPVAAQRYPSLRASNATAGPPARAVGLGVVHDERRAALDRAEELRAARQKAELAEAQVETEVPTGAPPPTELDIRTQAQAILAQAMGAETPFAMAKVSRWRKSSERLAASYGGLKEDAALGGRRLGDRVRLEEEGLG